MLCSFAPVVLELDQLVVNHPAANADTLIEDSHYAGSFALFLASHDGHHSASSATFLVDITDVM